MIATLDVAVEPLLDRLSHRAAFRGRLADRTLFGPDLFSVGGPYTARGYYADCTLIDRSGACPPRAYVTCAQ
jgi:hemolysin activation/secretion protein